MEKLAPVASKESYEKCWQDFLNYNEGSSDLSEDAFGIYLNHLKTDKEYQPTTIWKRFSMLNNTYQRRTGKKLQVEYPGLMLLLKSFEEGYTRKVSSIFSLQDILSFLSLPVEDKPSYWKLRKCAAVIGFTGGMRCAEIKDLMIEDLNIEPSKGVWVTFIPKKQRKEKKTKRFLVPFNQDDPAKCFATHIVLYLNDLKKSLGSKVSGVLFHTVKKSGNGYSKLPMGINYMYAMPRDIATALKLENPESYTGHGFRRSCATQMADSGANSVELRRFFLWKDDTTANQYIDESASNQARIANLVTKPNNGVNLKGVTLPPATSITPLTSTSAHETAKMEATAGFSGDSSNAAGIHPEAPPTVATSSTKAGNTTMNITVQTGAVLNLHM